jgi:multidrug efflux pump subunit AcrB
VRFYLPMDVLNDDENIAQLVVVAKNLSARDRLKAELDRLLARDFSDVVTRVSPLELGPPVGWPIRYRISGPHYDRVEQYAEKLAGILGQSRATRSVNMTAGEPERVITFVVNQTAARAAGVSSQDIAQLLNRVWSGQSVTTVRDHNRLVDVVLRANDADRLDLSSLAALKLTTAAGTKIAIGQVATLQWGLQDPVMWRRQGFPYVVVQTDVAAGMQAEATSAQLSTAVQQLRAGLAPGYTLDEEGTVAESDKGNGSVFAVLPVTLFVMLILLMVQLQRISRMLLALAMAPFGLPGIVLAMLPSGTPMGFVALLGMIALAGMIIRNAVILIMEADSNLRVGMSRNDAVSKAAEHRARPILLTACAAILGMIPISHQVFWGPMAYAIIGGLLVGTLMTLTVLPAALSLVMQRESASSAK